MTEVYSAIKEKVPQFAEMLMILPDSGVWIHEKALHRLLKLPQGNTFGPRLALTHLMRGIEKGYCGNRKKDFTKTGYTIIDFNKEHGSSSRISYQLFGKCEQFQAGKLNDSITTSNDPRWFKAEETLTDISCQLEIVDELLGETRGLPEDVEERRQNNYMSFIKNADEDGGYTKYDVPTIAYNWREAFGREGKPIKINMDF